MATFGDFIENFRKNVNPQGNLFTKYANFLNQGQPVSNQPLAVMGGTPEVLARLGVSPEQQADAAAYYADPFRKQAAIDAALEAKLLEEEAKKRAEQAAVAGVSTSDRSSYGQEKSAAEQAKNDLFWSWVDNTEEGQAYKAAQANMINGFLGLATPASLIGDLFGIDSLKSTNLYNQMTGGFEDMQKAYQNSYAQQWNSMPAYQVQQAIDSGMFSRGGLLGDKETVSNLASIAAQDLATFGYIPSYTYDDSSSSSGGYDSYGGSSVGGYTGTTESDTQSDAGGGSPSYGSGGWL
jgi:hypothetical protein